MLVWCDIRDQYPMKFDLKRMRDEIKKLEDSNWLMHYDKGLSRGWKAMPLISRHGEIRNEESQRNAPSSQMKETVILQSLPYFKEILDSFKCAKGRIRISKLEPGAGIGVHRDAGHEVANLAFNKVRLHIPIQTNDKVLFFVDGQKLHMAPGGLYYVNFSKKHWVRNDGSEPRYHLVMDLEVNEWLWQFFPKPSLWDKVGFVAQRIALPPFWVARQWAIKTSIFFWNRYEGSRLQRLRHELFPKTHA